MTTKQLWQSGEILNGIKFLKEVEAPKYRRGLFECPFCKSEFESRITHITNSATRSCGCMGRDGNPKQFQTNNKGYRSGAYRTWACMMQRCYGNDPSKQETYRDKGIIVSERWHSFANFFADMGERPKGKTLDRYPDKNGNYEPVNCRWATAKEQSRNINRNLIVTYKGETKTLAEWCDLLGLQYHRMRERIFRNDIPAEIAFTEPIRSAKICQMIKEFRNKKTA